ncbi:MAG: hypothetical protein Q9M36_07275, partial [Sulfurovum sp.]|nr:hypothetical protein [Sulfurovum sp.]
KRDTIAQTLVESTNQVNTLINSPQYQSVTPIDMKSNDLGFIKIMKIKKTSHKNIIIEENTPKISAKMETELERSINTKLNVFKNGFSLNITNIIDNLEMDIDYLATRIFNDLKDELDMEYR